VEAVSVVEAMAAAATVAATVVEGWEVERAAAERAVGWEVETAAAERAVEA